MSGRSDEDEKRRLAETAASLLTVAPGEPAPSTRLGRQTLMAEVEREKLSAALRPLPVGEAQDPAADLAIIGRLGQGGMAYVELARQHSLDREVALKRPKGGRVGEDGTAPALVDEARITGALEHPNIVPVHAVGRDEVLGPVVVLKRVQGAVWSDVLREDRARMHEEPAVLDKHLRILMQVSNALHYAHSRGVVHRDVKPSNVMLGDYGEVYLMDWGVAVKRDDASTHAAAVAGTSAYMAPEMVRGDRARQDARTDVYLLGATLHEVITGQRRHRGDNVLATLMQALYSRPASYEAPVPPGLGAIANRACSEDPELRFPTAAAFRDALADFMEQRETRLLVTLAGDLLDAIEAAEGSGLESTADEARAHAESSRRFHETRFALEQAARIRPDYPAVGRMRRRLQLAMIRQELAQDDVNAALALTEELEEPPPPELAALLEATRARIGERRRHLEALEKDADLLKGNRLRIWGTTIVAAMLILRHALSLLGNPGPGHDLDPGRLLLGMSVISAVVIPGLVAARGRLMRTRPDRAFFRLLLSFCLLTPLLIHVGMRFGMGVPAILTLITVACSGLLLAVEVPFPTLPFGLAGLAAGLVAAAYPDAARYLFMAWTTATVIGMVFDLRRERARELARIREG
ncbi:MAG: serine/threonine-protein kinase [Myxococcota bacterium]